MNQENKAIRFQKELINVRDFFDNFDKEVTSLEAELKEKDNETQDLLHYLELNRFNASKGYIIARELKRVREERRVIKDLLEVMVAVQVKINSSFTKINLLNEAIGEVRKINKQKNYRQYKPRVRVDLKFPLNNQEQT